MLTLYGAKGSGAAAVEAGLRIAGVPFQWIEAATWEPGAGLEALKRVNPLAQIPTLVLDDGTVMTESAAILIHLGLQYPSSSLLSPEATHRSQSIRGLVFIAANCYAAIGVIDYPERFCAQCDKAAAERIRTGTKARLHEYWSMFADQFVFFKDGHVGALELLAAVVSRWSGARAHLKANRPVFHGQLERVEGDPRIASIFKRHWP